MQRRERRDGQEHQTQGKRVREDFAETMTPEMNFKEGVGVLYAKAGAAGGSRTESTESRERSE